MFFALSRYSAALQQQRQHTEPLDALQDRCKQLARHRHLGHLERLVLGVQNDFRTDLDQLLPQRGQRLVPYGPRQRQPPQEVPEVVGQRE